MPSPDSYTYSYFLGTTPPDGATAYTNQYPTNTLTDGADGSNDDTTAVGDPLTWSGTALNPVTLYGFTADGDPIVAVTGTTSTNYWAVSDIDHAIDGSVLVGPVTTGTYTYCFAAGTRIATPEGACAVEDLRIGDPVTTHDGRTVPVKWLGQQTMQRRLAGDRMRPVRLRAGALDDGVPSVDLVVTADHAILVDGLMINAGALVNGTSIDWLPQSDLPEHVTFYHVETEDHSVILANGTPAETFIDYLDRRAFDNFEEYLDLYGAERIIPEMPRPRISAQRQVPETIRTRLGIRTQDPSDLRRSA